ncbi:MAG: DUF5671 domain-containing protein [Acidimicrobiia bacterium]
MSVVFLALVPLLIIGGLVIVGIAWWRRHDEKGDESGLDLIPYLLLALAVGVAGFSLARLARASVGSDRLIGTPSTEIAAALAGIVVAAPVAFFLWRRQAGRRRLMPETPGWPVYLMLLEGVFSIAFMVTVAQVADSLSNGSGPGSTWPNLVVYGAIVGFHWYSQGREPPAGEAGELPRLTGSAVSLVALAIGAYGLIHWLLWEGYDALTGGTDAVFVGGRPDPAIAIALTLVALPTWAYRWLPTWQRPSGVFRSLYAALISAISLSALIGATVTIVANTISYPVDSAGPASRYFGFIPTALSVGVVGAAAWAHHHGRLGDGRTSAVRTYQYSMAAIGLGVLVGSATALTAVAFDTRFIGGNPGQTLIGLGCSALASGAVWMWFWREAQTAPRGEEITTHQRRIYLIGMAIVTGLTAAGALIGTLVVLFRALLGDAGSVGESLRIPLALTSISGAAFAHLFLQLRSDGASMPRTTTGPFSVTIVCSHPGQLPRMLPDEATVRVLYRSDDDGPVTDAMAEEITRVVGTASSVVWVDGDGYRVARLRQ